MTGTFQMDIFVSFACLKNQLKLKRSSLKEIPTVLNSFGLSGLEIADRDLLHISDTELSILLQEFIAHSMKLILDINVDLTYKNALLYRSEIDHAIAQLRTARLMGIRLTRICLGGQTFSIQKLLKKRFRSTFPTPDGTHAGGQDTRYAVSRGRRIYRLARNIRRKTPVWVWQRDEKIERAIDSLKIIMTHAEKMDIQIGIENHWGISSRPDWILRVIERVGSPLLGTCPDFGNWPWEVSPDVGVSKLASHAFLTHIKSMEPREDIPEQFNSIARKIDILLDQGFLGPFTLEYEGVGDPWESVCITARMLHQHYS